VPNQGNELALVDAQVDVLQSVELPLLGFEHHFGLVDVDELCHVDGPLNVSDAMAVLIRS
jgi:hypothetical protein